MKRTNQTKSRRAARRALSVFTTLLTFFFVSQAANPPTIFTYIKISSYGGIPANTPGKLHIEADHFGRPIVAIECTYDFFIVDYDTKETIDVFENYNRKIVKLPTNSGRLNTDIDVKLPQGHYIIRYNYTSPSMEGPFYFTDFWIGEEPPTEQTARIDHFELEESWWSRVGASAKYHSREYGNINNEEGVITVNMEHWHSNLAEGKATIELYGEGSFTVNGRDDMVYNSKQQFTADFTQDVTLTVTSKDGTVTKDYTVKVANTYDGDQASLPDYISFRYSDKYGQYHWPAAIREAESSKFIMELPTKLSEVGYGFTGFFYPSFGASVVIDDNLDIEFVNWYSEGKGTYQGEATMDPAPSYTLTVTSADGKVTNEYTLRVIGKPTPPVWTNEEYCNAIRYQNESDNIEKAIPIAWLRYLSLHMSNAFLEEKTIRQAEVFLRQAEGHEQHWVATYPSHLPHIPENEIWFEQINYADIQPGDYEVILHVQTEPTEEEPWNTSQDYVLGGITLADETVYGISLAILANGYIGMNKDAYQEGDEVTFTVWGATGYEPETINVYKTGEENTEIPFQKKVNSTGSINCTFTMPAYDVTITATFRKKAATEDIEAVNAAQTAVWAADFTFAQTDTPTEEALKTALAAQINNLISLSTGITVTVGNIRIDTFKPAANGINGSFTFAVLLAKGEASVNIGANGTISAASVYSVTIGTFAGGSVSATPTLAAEGGKVTLTITIDEGYLFKSISAYKTTDRTISVTLEGTNNTRTFTMPAYGVTITAEFQKTPEREEKEVVETIKEEIEGGTFQIAQSAGNTEESLKAWIISTLRKILGEEYANVFPLRSDMLTGDVEITQFTPSIAGTAAKPKGTNGTFTFVATLKRGDTTIDKFETSGDIQATPYTTSPALEKRISLRRPDGLTAQISNTGDIATGKLTLTLSGDHADAFTLSATSIDNLNVAATADITLTPRSDLPAGDYKVTLTVSGSGLTSVSVEFTYTVIPTGIDKLQQKSLSAYIHGSTLHITGLAIGKPWSIYTLSGTLIRQGIAEDNETKATLSARGMYIIKSGKVAVKVVY